MVYMGGTQSLCLLWSRKEYFAAVFPEAILVHRDKVTGSRRY